MSDPRSQAITDLVGERRVKQFIPEMYKKGAASFVSYQSLQQSKKKSVCVRGEEYNVDEPKSKHELRRASKIPHEAFLVISL